MVAAFEQIALAVSSGLGGPYHPSRVITVSDAVYDDGGSIITPGAVMERDCSVQVDSCTEAMRAEAGYTERDVRLLIIGLTGPLDTDARVQVLEGPNPGTYLVQSVGNDPFAVYRECRARPA